ncbi:UDP-glycosyltransferase [Flavobacterium sp. XS2P12]|uniref:UDP-glycosyltransferase n=1 Tax=Flavobacterium melibiosi TaxID=3398734 RepID=UPI003A8A9D9A
MKILVVVDSIDIEDSSGSKANVALINNLIKAGYEVLVYHYTRKDIQLSGVRCFSIPEIKYSPLYFMSRVQRIIQRKTTINLALFFEKRFGFSFTFFNDTRSIANAIKKITFQTDLVLTLSKGASFRPHYALLQIPQLQDKWMAYIHDPYPFYFYPKPYKWLEPSHKFKEAFFKEVSQKAKYSAFPSQLLQEWMGGYFPGFLKTGILVPHQNAKVEVQHPVLPSYFDASKFNLLHAGNLLDARSPKGLIEGFKLFLERNPIAKDEIRLLLIGPSSHFSKIIQGYQKEIPELIVKNENVNFDAVYHIQKQAAVNIILEAKSEISPFLPAKFVHCVEANKMILSLAPSNSEVRRLLGEDYPYWSEVDDVKSIATIVEKMYLLWKQNPENLLLNRIDLEQYLSAENLKQTIDRLNLTSPNS